MNANEGEADVAYLHTGKSCDGTSQQGLCRLDIGDVHVSNSVLRIVVHLFAIAEANKNRGSRPLHLDVFDNDAVDPAAIYNFKGDSGDDAFFIWHFVVVDH